MDNIEKKPPLWSELLGKDLTSQDNKKLKGASRKTATKIKLALLDLIAEKPLDEISITNLVKVAEIYRATFYLHYKSLNDVIEDIERDVYECYNNIKLQMENVDIYNNMEVLIEMIGEYIKIDRKYLKIIINTNYFNRITLSLKSLLYEIVVTNFTKFGHMRKDDEFMLDISMFTGGLVFVYRDWINNLDMEFEVLEIYIKKISEQLFKNAN